MSADDAIQLFRTGSLAPHRARRRSMRTLHLVTLCVALQLAVASASSAQAAHPASPWPLVGRDSAQTFAAAPGVPAYTAYKASILPIAFNNYSIPFIPASGLHVVSDWFGGTITVYNRTSGVARNISSPYLIAGFDPQSALRGYFFEPPAPMAKPGIGAFSLETLATIWSVKNSSFSELFIDTFSDTLTVFEGNSTGHTPAPYASCYIGSSGKLLWRTQIEGTMLCTIPASGVSVVQSSLGTLTALDTASGKTVWSVASSEAIRVAFANVLVSGDPKSVYALDGSTGKQLWISSAVAQYGCGQPDRMIAVALTNATFAFVASLYCGGRFTLFALDGSSGKTLNTQSTVTAPVTGVPLLSIGPTVFYAIATSLYSWNVLTSKHALVYTDILPLTALLVDADGAILALPSPGVARLLVPSK